MASSRCGLQVKARSKFFCFRYNLHATINLTLLYSVTIKEFIWSCFPFIEVKVSETLASYLRQRVSPVGWSDRLKYFFSERKYF